MNTQRSKARCFLMQIRFAQVAVIASLLALFPALGRAGTWIPFGPKSYPRGTVGPDTVTDPFTLLNPATQ